MRARRRECLTCTAKASGSTTSRPRCGGPVLGIAEQNTRPRCGVQNTGRGGPRQGGWPLRANRRRRAAGGAERLCRPAAREPVAASSQLRHARDLTPAGRRGKRLQRPARHHGDQSGRRRPAAHRRGRGGGAEAPGGGRPHALLHRGRDAVARARLPRHPMGRAARAAQAGRQVRREPCTPDCNPCAGGCNPMHPDCNPGRGWLWFYVPRAQPRVFQVRHAAAHGRREVARDRAVVRPRPGGDRGALRLGIPLLLQGTGRAEWSHAARHRALRQASNPVAEVRGSSAAAAAAAAAGVG